MNKGYDIIKDRLQKRLEKIDWSQILVPGTYTFFVAGSSLLKDRPNDYDVFGLTRDCLVRDARKHTSRNAITYSVGDTEVQVCNYWKPSLRELIQSFDFAHVQIGATVHVEVTHQLGGCSVKVIGVEATEAFEEAMISGNSRFMGSEYPLSSLMRLCKYKERGLLGNWKADMFLIVTAIVQRGFKDYADFKDQLEAVDLAYVEESSEARALFEALVKR